MGHGDGFQMAASEYGVLKEEGLQKPLVQSDDERTQPSQQSA